MVKLITGTVMGFVLIVDPDNNEGKRERIESKDALEIRQQHRDYSSIGLQFLTRYKRDDNGSIDEQEGCDLSGKTKVGDPAYLATCRCKKKSWLQLRKESMSHLNENFDCGEHDLDDNPPSHNDMGDREY